MALTNMAITKAKPKDKPYKLHDSNGLYLQVNPSGSKIWKYDFRLQGKRGTYTIGPFPDHSLKEAREELIKARKLVGNGVNPTNAKKINQAKQSLNEKRFSDYAKEWISKQNYADSTLVDINARLEKNIYPHLDSKPVNEFTTLDLLDIMKVISDRGARETAVRLSGLIRKVFNELLILRLIDTNPAQGLSELLPKPDHRSKGNFSHITDEAEFQSLIQQIHSPAISMRQDKIVTYALKLMPLLFLRPKNIRFMKWSQISFSQKLLTIPASEMKSGKELKVPLANQATKLLKEIKQHTDKYEYVFVTRYGRPNPMSENTTTAAIKRLINPKTGEPFGTGFMTSHGFRHTASTMLNEKGYEQDAIELQLAHISKDRIRATYNKAELMPQRTKMMQEWADYVYSLLEK